jgi:hypothetical protein
MEKMLGSIQMRGVEYHYGIDDIALNEFQQADVKYDLNNYTIDNINSDIKLSIIMFNAGARITNTSPPGESLIVTQLTASDINKCVVDGVKYLQGLQSN